jgi:hypothetical protein
MNKNNKEHKTACSKGTHSPEVTHSLSRQDSQAPDKDPTVKRESLTKSLLTRKERSRRIMTKKLTLTEILHPSMTPHQTSSRFISQRRSEIERRKEGATSVEDSIN